MRVEIKKKRASGNRESWFRIVKSVDSTQKGVKAFDGVYISHEGEHDFLLGTVILEVVPSGSVKRPEQNAIVYVVTKEGLIDVSKKNDKGEYLNWKTKFLSICDNVKEALERDDRKTKR